jgi:hypothetical protein
MKYVARILAAAVLTLSFCGSEQALAGTNGATAFDQLKALVGHWQTESTNRQQATLDLSLTANGTALFEKFRTVEDGKEVEMITLYYLDGDHLKMTHYCMAGNQPTLRATYAPGPKTITFDFESASNLKSLNEGHMHHAVYTFLDNDHFRTRWTFQKDQKDAFTEDVTYVRLK